MEQKLNWCKIISTDNGSTLKLSTVHNKLILYGFSSAGIIFTQIVNDTDSIGNVQYTFVGREYIRWFTHTF